MVATLQRTDQIMAQPEVTRQAQDALAGLDRERNPSALSQASIGQELGRVLDHVVRSLAEGHAVTVSTVPEVLTSTIAAELIGISRPTLMRKARAGEIASHKVGTHTRFRHDDVLRFKREQLERQRQAMTELLALEDELGITK